MNIAGLTVRAAAAGLREGAFSSLELVAALLAAVRGANPALNAYIWLDEEDALRQAREADAALAAGRPGPLLGVPLAVQDNISVEGQPCGCASRILEGYRAPFDATAAARLRAAGALLVGRANMDEFALGPATATSCHGPTRNPADHGRLAGGGAAAAVAGGIALGAVGTDTGGSIRRPAAFCGCLGVAPSYGRVSRFGVVACASSLDRAGPLARDVRDAALLLRVMAGHDPRDAVSAEAPVPDYVAGCEGGLRGLRLGLPRECFAAAEATAEIAGLARAAAAVCESLGARPAEVGLPHISCAAAACHAIVAAEASTSLARFDGVRYGRRAAGVTTPREMYCRTRGEFLGREVKRRIILGTHLLSGGAGHLRAAAKVRTLIRRDFEEAFRRCDVLLAPVMPATAWRDDAVPEDPVQVCRADIFTAAACLAGICALAVPCGRAADGLPVGLQVLGPAFAEERILRVAAACEQAVARAEAPSPPAGGCA